MKKFAGLLLFFIFLISAARGDDYVWIGDVDDTWSDVGNWEDENGDPVVNYPGEVSDDDTVLIENGSVVLDVTDVEIAKLTITDSVLTGVGDITVSGDFEINGGLLEAASLTVNGTSTIGADITTSGDQIYVDVTLSNARRTFTSTGGYVEITVTVSRADANAELIVNASGGITMSGDIQTAGDAVTLTSNQDIEIIGNIDCYSLAVTAGGTVTIDGDITVTSVDQTHDNTAAVYIEADTLTGNGGINLPPVGGWVCVNVSDYQYSGDVTDGHIHHEHLPPGTHIVYRPGADLGHYTGIPQGSYTYIDADDTDISVTTSDGIIFIIDVGNTDKSVSFSAGMYIEIRGAYESTGTLTLNPGDGQSVRLANSEDNPADPAELNLPSFNFTGTLELHGGTASITATTGDIELRTVEGSAAGTNDLTLNSSGITLGNIGTTVTVGNLILNGSVTYNGNIAWNSGGSILLGSTLTGTGNITINSMTVTLEAAVTTSGMQAYNGDMSLNNNIVLEGSTVTLGAVTGGNNDLTINGNAVFNGELSGLNELTVNGNSTISADITTAGAQTYGSTAANTVTLGGAVALDAGTTVSLRTITGAGNNLTITADTTTLNGGSGIGALQITGDAVFAGAITGTASVEVTGESEINANITATGTQEFTGAVTLGGTGTRIFTGSTVMLNEVDGNGLSLTVTGDAVFNDDVIGVVDLSVSGTVTGTNLTVDATGNINLNNPANSVANVNLTGSGTITYNSNRGALNMLNITAENKAATGGNITITEQTGSITAGTITAANSAVTLTSGNNQDLTIDGNINCYSLAMITGGSTGTTGTVTINGDITVTSTVVETHNESEAVYIWAGDLAINTATIYLPNASGSVCVEIFSGTSGAYVTDSTFADKVSNGKIHYHILSSKNIVYGVGDVDELLDDITVKGVTLVAANNYEYIKADDNSLGNNLLRSTTESIYIVDVGNAAPGRIVTFNAQKDIYVIGNYVSDSLSLSPGSGMKVIFIDNEDDAPVTINLSSLTINGTLDLQTTDPSEITTTGNIELTAVTGTGKDLTLNSGGSVKVDGAVGGASARFGDLKIERGAATFGGAIFAANYAQDSGSAVFTASQNYSNDFTFTGTTLTIENTLTAGSDVTITNSGLFTLSGNISSNGAFTQSGTGNNAINADISANNGVNFSRAVTLDGDITSTNGDIDFGGALSLSALHSLTSSGGSVTATGGIVSGTAGVTVNANKGIEITNSGNTLSGAVTLSNSQGAVATRDGEVKFTTTGNVTVTGGATGANNASSGDFTIKAGSITVGTGGIYVDTASAVSLNTANNQDITVTGNITCYSLSLTGGSDGKTGTVTINGTITTTSTEESDDTAEGSSVFISADSLAGGGVINVPTGAGNGWVCINITTDEDFDDAGGLQVRNAAVATNATGQRYHFHFHGGGSTPTLRRIVYSFVEDGNGNGKVDRIRVQANVNLNGNFTGFKVSVEDYQVDVTVSTNGFAALPSASDGDSFYIYLVEGHNLYDGKPIKWRVTDKGSLDIEDTGTDEIFTTINTIPPRISYAFTLPGRDETYIRMSQPVADANVNISGSKITTSDISTFKKDMQSNGAATGVIGYLVKLNALPTVSELAGLPAISSANPPAEYFIIDKGLFDLGTPAVQNPGDPLPKYPVNWNYSGYSSNTAASFCPPNKLLTMNMVRTLATPLGSVTPTEVDSATDTGRRRSTDVLVSVSLSSGDYFAWPQWARGSSSSIREFDGTKSLESGDITIQADVNKDISGFSGLSMFYAYDVPVGNRNPADKGEIGRKSGGLWLPAQDQFYFVPDSPIQPPPSRVLSSGSPLIYEIGKDGGNGSRLDFLFKLEGISDADDALFIARLDAPAGTVPNNWYEIIRPFTFDIQDVKLQRGGVTILNNVINSNNRDTTYIRYNLVRPGRVTVQVYTLEGLLVKSLRRNEYLAAGVWTDEWDGTNNRGRAVARGIYFIKVVGPDINEIRKIMVIK